MRTRQKKQGKNRKKKNSSRFSLAFSTNGSHSLSRPVLVSSSSKRGRRAEKMNLRDQRLASITSAMFGDPLPRGERERERSSGLGNGRGFPLRTSVDRIAAIDRFSSSSRKPSPRKFSRFSASHLALARDGYRAE